MLLESRVSFRHQSGELHAVDEIIPWAGVQGCWCWALMSPWASLPKMIKFLPCFQTQHQQVPIETDCPLSPHVSFLSPPIFSTFPFFPISFLPVSLPVLVCDGDCTPPAYKLDVLPLNCNLSPKKLFKRYCLSLDSLSLCGRLLHSVDCFLSCIEAF